MTGEEFLWCGEGMILPETVGDIESSACAVCGERAIGLFDGTPYCQCHASVRHAEPPDQSDVDALFTLAGRFELRDPDTPGAWIDAANPVDLEASR